MNYDIQKDYDKKLKKTLEAKLNRPAKSNEIINADNDADLVNETLWQIIVQLEERISALEKKPK